jgi:hypothetical protein
MAARGLLTMNRANFDELPGKLLLLEDRQTDKERSFSTGYVRERALNEIKEQLS